ncbi:hypothetical protein [Streptomyces sp900105755]|uniref:Uncharacterized protein n=1 Tax=Streptomyces sp. 900105755 TaxID=3154389 RepID=A0ABV1TDU4_9ACTN
MRIRTVTAGTTLAVLFSSAALAAAPAYADTSALLPVKSLGDIVVDGKGDVGWRFRVRSDYIDGSSGDTVNSTTYGAWKYFTFTS